MKYLAILKDSFREAIDAKILYVMVALSGVLIVLLASISFRPVALQEEVESVVQTLNWWARLQAREQAPRFELSEFAQLNDAAEPWLGDYRFVLSLHPPKEGLAKAQQMSSSLIKVIMRNQLPWLENLEVQEGTPAPPGDVRRFVVTTHGTSISSRRGWSHEPSVGFGAVPLPFMRSSLGYCIYWIENWLVNAFGAWIAILIGIVITAFFVPNMLRKGSVDLLLVKPIHRPTLLVLKYVGGLSFILINAAIVVLGIWVALGLRSGIWASGFLATIVVLTYFFAILYSVSTLFGVLTRSPIVAILMTCLVWLILWVVGIGYSLLDNIHQAKLQAAQTDRREAVPAGDSAAGQVDLPEWVYVTVKAIHYVLPRTSDLDHLTTRLLSREVVSDAEIQARKIDTTQAITWGESLTVSGVFIAVMLGLACWRFSTKDY
jgi:ABC-type transport system involved in multi-copper enzyme maturation permease subunit